MKFVITLLLFFSTAILNAQVTTVYDTTNVKYSKYYYDDVGIDSLVFILDSTKYTALWKVFYDLKKTQLAYETLINGDTTKQIHHWRNGTLKYISTSIFDSAWGGYVWYYEELHCENGQLISKFFPNNLERQLCTNYYCNGKKKLEFERVGVGCEGEMKFWYENGNIQEIRYFKDNKEDGEWKYYTPSGEIDYIEKYDNGKLIFSSKK